MEDHLERFDPKCAHKVAKTTLPIFETYHRTSWHGLENIPDEVFLGVGNHTGMHFMPESFLWLAKYHAEIRNVPMLTLVHHMIHDIGLTLRLPVNELGFVEANRDNALKALKSGFAITVYPGGDRDVARSYKDRHRIDFFTHLGYVKMALKAQVPIVPIVGCGGGETLFVIDNGEKIAEFTGLKKHFKVHTWPLFWSFPFGFHLGHFPHFGVPLPAQVSMSVLEPIRLDDYQPSDAEDPVIVREINCQVMDAMQNEMDRMAEGRIPIIGKLR
jgi:1-acyl-sn-glycerol-3-phosphate acyltransferase